MDTPSAKPRQAAHEALVRVNLVEAADRKVAGYSKGMRQRIRLAQAICHQPYGPGAGRAAQRPRSYGARGDASLCSSSSDEEGLHVIISSHILHEVDQISDQVILLSLRLRGRRRQDSRCSGRSQRTPDADSGSVRPAFARWPRAYSNWKLWSKRSWSRPKGIAAPACSFALAMPTRFYLGSESIVLEDGITLESVAPADDDVLAVYQYLIGSEGGCE